jgi:DNA-binding CsgD family transcriptional regulator
MTYSAENPQASWNFGAAQNWNSIISAPLQDTISTTSPDIFEQWLNNDSPDRFLVDRNGKVLWCAIKTYQGQHQSHSKRLLAKIKVGAVLPSELFLPILTAGSLPQSTSGRMAVVEEEGGRQSLAARVCTLGTDKHGPLGVTIVSHHDLCEDVRADLKRLWDLSAGEIRVLTMTFQGLTAQEVADKAQISIETVRTHVRHIYAKVGVNSREALFASLGPIIC